MSSLHLYVPLFSPNYSPNNKIEDYPLPYLLNPWVFLLILKMKNNLNLLQKQNFELSEHDSDILLQLFVTVFFPPAMSYLHHNLSKPSLLFTSPFLIYYLSKNEGYVLISPRTYFANKLLCTYGNKPRGIFCFKYGCVIVERFFSCHLERTFFLPSSFNQTAPEIFCSHPFCWYPSSGPVRSMPHSE